MTSETQLSPGQLMETAGIDYLFSPLGTERPVTVACTRRARVVSARNKYSPYDVYCISRQSNPDTRPVRCTRQSSEQCSMAQLSAHYDDLCARAHADAARDEAPGGECRRAAPAVCPAWVGSDGSVHVGSRRGPRSGDAWPNRVAHRCFDCPREGAGGDAPAGVSRILSNVQFNADT